MNKKKFWGIALGSLAAVSVGTALITNAVNAKKNNFDGWENFYTFNSQKSDTQPDKLLHVPLYRQATNYTCGATCVISILRYADYMLDIREDNASKALGSNKNIGTTMVSMSDYLNAVKLDDEKRCFESEIRQNMTIEDLVNEIDKGNPVICAIQAWSSDITETGDYDLNAPYKDAWEDGHYAIAIGYNEENIFFMDPSTGGCYTYIPKDKLDDRWHDYDGKKLKNGTIYEHAGVVVKMLQTPEMEANPNAIYALM